MENVLLSLLLIKSMTIYEIKLFIEQYLNSVCSNSLGSVQAALRKLIEKDKITYHEYEEKGHKKKEYRITEAGIQQFLSWIQTPMDWNKGKNMEESKFFFLGMQPKGNRIKMVQKLIQDLTIEQGKLLEIHKIIEMTKDTMVDSNAARMMQDPQLVKNLLLVSGEETLEAAVQSAGDYQCYMVEYGLKKVETDLEFFKMIYEREVCDGTETKHKETGENIQQMSK